MMTPGPSRDLLHVIYGTEETWPGWTYIGHWVHGSMLGAWEIRQAAL